MKILSFYLLTLLTIVTISANAQGNFNALPWRQNIAYNAYLLRQVHQQYTDRREALNIAQQSKTTILEYRYELRKRYQSILGNFPDKQALNGKVLQTTQKDGYRIETIVFESLPKRYVTANLYLPAGDGPFPASLSLCGHGISGKYGTLAAVTMALNGIAVLVVDPIGQGERVQFLDEKGKPTTRGATSEHTLLNAGCNLLGSSLAAYEWWDNHRALDYLETRPDIDKTRFGVYGSSGGGTQTAYLIGLEDRLKVASICSYFSQRERVLELQGASDGCQHVSGEGEAHIEIADWVTMFAPKPVLVMSGLYDFVDYWGAAQGSSELQQVYTAMGAPDNFRQFTAECGHGMPQEKREALVTWFRKWLYNDPTPVHEKEVTSAPLNETLCTSTGQVLTAYADAVSVQSYNLDLGEKLSEQRRQFLSQDNAVIRQKVLDLLGVDIPKEPITPEQTGFIEGDTYDVYKYQIIRKGEMPVPCVVVMPKTIAPSGNVVLYLNESGKADLLSNDSTLHHFINRGDLLVAADLRGYGETTDPVHLNESKYWNREYRNAMISLHIGRTIVGQRVTDVLSLLDFISTDTRFAGRPIHLTANGTYGPVAIHATFLDQRIAQTKVSHSIHSYLEYLQNPMQQDVFTNVIPGVLGFYDLGDLAGKAGEGRVRFGD